MHPQDERSQAAGLLLLRIALASVFLAHGLAKPLLFSWAGTEAFFQSQGFAGWMAYPVFAAEVTGAVLLGLGIFSRLAALGLVPITLGVVATHLPNGWLFNVPNGGWEFGALLLALVAVVVLVGPGPYVARIRVPALGRRLA